MKDPHILWVCSSCLEEGSETKTRTEAKMEHMLSIVPLMHSINARLENLETNLMGKKLEEKIEEVVEKKLAEVIDEQKEKDKRKHNLIISNLKESAKTDLKERQEEDVNMVRETLSKLVTLTESDVVEPVRLGKVGGTKPRLLKVKIRSEEKRREILKNAPKMNEKVQDQSKKIYINPDYTPKERELNQALRQERKQRMAQGETDLIIRDGKIMKRKKVQTDRNNEDGSEDDQSRRR